MPEPRPTNETRSWRAALLRRLAHGAFLMIRPMTLGARVAAFDDGGRVLLVKHSYVSGWHFPGGGVDAGETADYAAQREMVEARTKHCAAGCPLTVSRPALYPSPQARA